jgi:hypothetical protein
MHPIMGGPLKNSVEAYISGSFQFGAIFGWRFDATREQVTTERSRVGRIAMEERWNRRESARSEAGTASEKSA